MPGLQRLDLVAHERAQWGDDQGERSGTRGGKLVAHALAAAGRHDRDQVMAGQDRRDGLQLAGAKRRVSIRALQLAGRGLNIRVRQAGPHDLVRIVPQIQVFDIHCASLPYGFGHGLVLSRRITPLYHIGEINISVG